MSAGHLRRLLVVTCIRPCRKTKPVVALAEAVEKCARSHHSGATPQPEKSCRPGSGGGAAWAPIKVIPRTRHQLAVLASLALLPLVTCVGGLLEPRSNTAGIEVGGEFDAKRAFAELERLVSFGPRQPGSRALEQSRESIIGELRAAGATVDLDSFNASTPLGPIPMANIVAKVPGTSSAVVIIAGHYDTKRTSFPFVGANDAGSSAAFLLEMARVLARRKRPLSYWLVFFDGEEAFQLWSYTDGLYGSRHFAQELSAQGPLNQVRAVILVDMIADAHLDIHREAHSTPWLTVTKRWYSPELQNGGHDEAQSPARRGPATPRDDAMGRPASRATPPREGSSSGLPPNALRLLICPARPLGLIMRERESGGIGRACQT